MIVNENPRRSEHVISGSGPLPFNFGILSADDIKVIQDGITLSPVQYQVTGVGEDGGGTIILATAPANGTQVVILGNQPYKQTSVYTLEAFPPQRLQSDFNKLVIMIQQILEIINRTPKFAESSLLDVAEIPEPTAVDLFLKVVTLNPLSVGWGTLAVLAGAIGIPVSPVNGGTGGNYANTYAMLQGIGAAQWGPMVLTPVAGLITLPNPLTGNRVAVGAGAIISMSTSGMTIGTEILLDYVTGANALTDSANFQLQGRSNYTTIAGDVSRFYFNGNGWIEVYRSPVLAIANAPKFLRGDGTWQTVSTQVPTGVNRGLTISNNLTDPINDIDIAPGDAFSDDADPSIRVQMYSSGGFVKQLDNSWVAGTGVGGRVIGQTLTDGTWHVFMFRRLGGATDFCFSNSLAFVTPDNGTNRVCIMSVLRESGSIIAIRQEGDWVGINVPSITTDVVNPGITALVVGLRSPSGIKCRARYVLQLRTSGIAVVGLTSDLATADNAPSLDSGPLYNIGLVNGNHLTTVRELETMTNTLNQIRFRAHASDGGTRVRFVTTGFFHPRGRR